MPGNIPQLFEQLDTSEQAEVETFAAFVIARRTLKQPGVLTNDIPIQELAELVMKSGCFDWLNDEGEDVYTIEDGEAIQWPTP